MKKRFIWYILAAFILSIIVGIMLGENASFVQPLGDLFLRLIKFIIVPLILATIIVGVTSAGSVRKLSRLGGKTLGYYLATSFIAISIGLIFGYLFTPGTNTGIDTPEPSSSSAPAESEGVIQTILNIVPTNPMEALTTGNILQIIFFAICIGIGIILVGESALPVQRFFNGLADIMYKITNSIMLLVPFGIFGLLTPIIGEYGLSVLLPLLKLILAVLAACIIHAGIVYALAVKSMAKMNPFHFFKGIFPAAAVAFSTSSSSGTLPVTMKNTQENLNVSKETSSFTLPLGATINMDGTAIYLGIATVFISQYYQIELSFPQLLTLALVATLASIGTAGVPGAGLIMLTMALTVVSLPLEGIALIASIDRILDMMRTSVNVIGDASASVVVDASESQREIKHSYTK